MPDARTPLILDVDTGIDDALGLLLACASPAANLLGVSTVAGNVDLARATGNTRAVLALAGRADIEVWPGCLRPILREAEDASAIHGGSGLGHAILPEPPPVAKAFHAIDKIVESARRHAGELVLVATGPLTNVAVALMRAPELPKLLKRLVLMGGAFKEGGNTTPAAEFNIWHDPEAARIVFRSFGGPEAAPLIAVGLDVTRRTLLLPGPFDRTRPPLRRRARTRPPSCASWRIRRGTISSSLKSGSGAAISSCTTRWRWRPPSTPRSSRPQPSPSTWRRRGRSRTAMTVADWRGVWRRVPNAQVATAVRADAMIEGFLAAMERLARR